MRAASAPDDPLPDGRESGEPERVSLGYGGLFARPGDHIAHFYESVEDRRALLVPFIREGLEQGDRCVYLAGSDGRKDLRSGLEAEGIDVEEARSDGRLELRRGLTTPQELHDLLRVSLEEAAREATLLRWSGEMTWATDTMEDSRELMEWETICNRVEERDRAIFLCQYRLAAFPGTVVMDALRTHALSVVGRAVRQNPFYMDPEAFLEEMEGRPATVFA